MPLHTLAEKILLAHCDADEVAPGDVVMVRCDAVMANDVSGPVAFRQMAKMGVERVFDSSKVVMVADHFMPAKDARSAELQRRLKEWSDTQGVTFYGQGRGGIEHTLLCEEGWVVPGSVIAGGDSHTCTYGALGAFGSGLGSTDIAACLALGEFWQTVPATIQVEFIGEKRPFVTGASTSGCVRATAVDALQHGYRVVVPREAVGDRNLAAHEANLYDIDAKYGDVLPLEAVVEHLGQFALAKR